MTKDHPATQALLRLADHCRALDARITRTPPHLREKPSWQRETIRGLDPLQPVYIQPNG